MTSSVVIVKKEMKHSKIKRLEELIHDLETYLSTAVFDLVERDRKVK